MKKSIMIIIICFSWFIFASCNKNEYRQEYLISSDIQTKVFTGVLSNSSSKSIDIRVNEWLKENNVIIIEIKYDYEVHATNSPGSSVGLCYIIYKEV